MQRVDFGDAHRLRAFERFFNLIACGYRSFFQHAQIKSRTVMRHHQGRHLGSFMRMPKR